MITAATMYVSSIAVSALCYELGSKKVEARLNRDGLKSKELPKDEKMILRAKTISLLAIPGLNIIFGLTPIRLAYDDHSYDIFKKDCLDTNDVERIEKVL